MIMHNIFEGVQFIDESRTSHTSCNDLNISPIYTEGEYIKNCEFAITEQMIAECCNNPELISRAAITEGAKIDWALKNWMKEGKDYKGLKKEVNKIIEANNMSKEDLVSKGKGFMHVCKRILQIYYDISIPIGAVTGITGAVSNGSTMAALAGVSATPVVGASVLGAIIGLVIGFIINRLIRYLVDTIEFNTIKNDANTIVSELRSNARKANDKKIAEKMNKEADRLEDAIIKYSKNNK